MEQVCRVGSRSKTTWRPYLLPGGLVHSKLDGVAWRQGAMPPELGRDHARLPVLHQWAHGAAFGSKWWVPQTNHHYRETGVWFYYGRGCSDACPLWLLGFRSSRRRSSSVSARLTRITSR